MNVRTLCLAILYEGDATGYEIRKMSTEGEYAYFVAASFGSIYPALAKLEDESLVSSQVELQEGRPAKKVYAITEAGREAFVGSLFENLDEDTFRSEFLLFAKFAPLLPSSLVETRLNEQISSVTEELETLQKLLDDNTGVSDSWVLNYGINCLRVARDHIQTHMHELIEMARPDVKNNDAAE